MERPHNKNLCVDPQDPDYDDSFDYEKELEEYDRACEEREEMKRLSF